MKRDDLCITVPSFFRCPISLDVMKSPVSLCTGVTYDRSSIQRWLDDGNNICPATMQVLDTKDFVPNHTLQRLIQIWSNSVVVARRSGKEGDEGSEIRFYSLTQRQVVDLMEEIKNPEEGLRTNQFDCFMKLLCFASESVENRRFLAGKDMVRILIQTVCSYQPLDDDACAGGDGGDDDDGAHLDVIEAVVKILQLIVKSIEDKSKLRNLFFKTCYSAMAKILRHCSSDCRIAISSILETVASAGTESKTSVAETSELTLELIRALNLITESKNAPSNPDPVSKEIEAILSFFNSLSTSKRNKIRLVRGGLVKVIGKLLSRSSADVPLSTLATESAFKLLEDISGCGEGRTAISEDPNCVSKVVQKLLKVSTLANEHGAALLWCMCFLFRDQRAKEAVNKGNGLTKLLLLMQSDCSPVVKQMCGDLLRIFRVNSKSCLASYDTKTTHIMPF